MKLEFGARVRYKALDENCYPAVVLGEHTSPSEGDYQIAYEVDRGQVRFTHCWASSLTRDMSMVLELLEKERQRAMNIAYSLMKQHKMQEEAQKRDNNRLHFIEGELAEACREIGNAISGGDARSITLGETMRDRLEKEYFND